MIYASGTNHLQALSREDCRVCQRGLEIRSRLRQIGSAALWRFAPASRARHKTSQVELAGRPAQLRTSGLMSYGAELRRVDTGFVGR
jgi:hypothetical protein